MDEPHVVCGGPRSLSTKVEVFLAFYSLAIRAFYLLLLLGQFCSKTLRRQKICERNATDNLSGLCRLRSQKKFAVLFYCSSAGEYEQAKPLINRFATSQDTFIHIYFQSISGLVHARNLGETHSMCLTPIDYVCHWRRVFDVVKPNAVVVVRNEFWPGFLSVAYQRSRVYIVNCTIGVYGRLAVNFKRFLASFSDRIFFVSDEAASQLNMVKSHVICVTGDTKFDRLLERKRDRTRVLVDLKAQINAFFYGKKLLILGSAWKRDVEILLQAYAELGEQQAAADLGIVIVPHNTDDNQVRWMERMCRYGGLRTGRYSALVPGERSLDVLIADLEGRLFELYGCCDMAFVGGGFDQGVHNALEPLAFSLPTCFGEKIDDQFEALELVKNGLASTIRCADDLRAWIRLNLQSNSVSSVKLQRMLKGYSGAGDEIVNRIRRDLESNYSRQRQVDKTRKQELAPILPG